MKIADFIKEISVLNIDELFWRTDELIKSRQKKEASKDKLYEKLQNLDVCDKNYDRKFDDLQKVLDKLYDYLILLRPHFHLYYINCFLNL